MIGEKVAAIAMTSLAFSLGQTAAVMLSNLTVGEPLRP